MRWPLWRVFVLLGLAGVGGYFLLGSGSLAQAVLYVLLEASVVAALLVGVRLHRPRRPVIWYLLAGGQFSFLLADLGWSWYQFALHRDAPYPSVVDVLYLLGYPLFVAAFVVLIRSTERRRDWGAVLDSVIVAVGAALLSWTFFIEPYFHDPTLHLAERTISMTYPAMDILLLAVLARLFTSGAARTTAFRLLAASLMVTLATDCSSIALTLSGSYFAGAWVDAGWPIAYILLGAAALHPSVRELSARTRPSHDASMLRLVALAAASLMAPAVLVIQVARGRPLSVAFVTGGSAVMFLLVVTRMSLLLRALAAQRRELAKALEELSRAEADRRRLLDSTVGATEEERKRIAAELHDGPIQGLTRLGLLLARASLKLDREDVTGTRTLLDQVKQELSGDIQELRRTMASLRPPVLDERGLDAALRDYADALFREAGLPCTVSSSLDVRLPASVETVLYRVGQEALFNIVKHARATSAGVSLQATDGSVVLEVRDDGRGFDPDRVAAG